MHTPLAASFAFVLLVAGCGDGQEPVARVAVAAPVARVAVAAPVAAPKIDDTGEAGIVAFHARILATEVGLDAATEARVAALLERAWSAAQDDVRARIDATLPVDEEVVSELLLTRQREADREIAALLTPAQRERFEELGGRIGADDEQRVIVDGGAR